jgi:hypothetical protein
MMRSILQVIIFVALFFFGHVCWKTFLFIYLYIYLPLGGEFKCQLCLLTVRVLWLSMDILIATKHVHRDQHMAC